MSWNYRLLAQPDGDDWWYSIHSVYLIESIIDRMDGVFPDYHYDIVKDYLDDDC